MTEARQPGLLWQSLSAWGDLRASFRRLLTSDPSEAKLLAIAMISGVFVFMANIAAERIAPANDLTTAAGFRGFVGAQVITAMFFRTLMLYGLAAIFAMALRRFGGDGDWKATRAAVFWAALVGAPILFLATVLEAVASLQTAPQIAGLIGQLGSIAFALLLSVFLAEAHGFRRPWAIFAGIFVVSLVLIALAGLLAGSGGT